MEFLSNMTDEEKELILELSLDVQERVHNIMLPVIMECLTIIAMKFNLSFMDLTLIAEDVLSRRFDHLKEHYGKPIQIDG